MSKINVSKILTEWTGAGKINPYYDLRPYSIKEIAEKSGGEYDAIINSFIVGYAQGVRATKAEMKRYSNIGGKNETA